MFSISIFLSTLAAFSIVELVRIGINSIILYWNHRIQTQHLDRLKSMTDKFYDERKSHLVDLKDLFNIDDNFEGVKNDKKFN